MGSLHHLVLHASTTQRANAHMNYVPFGFEPIEPSTWAYLSSRLMLALFFKFNRFWSFRNFDLILIILLAPGLLMVHYGQKHGRHAEQIKSNATQLVMESQAQAKPSPSPASEQDAGATTTGSDDASPPALTRYERLQRYGYLWLFAMGLVWLVRLWYDPLIKRKPMLEPNLSLGGLVFLACSLMIFLFANVLSSQPADLSGPKGAAQLVNRSANYDADEFQKHGPGYPLLHLIPAIPTFVDSNGRPAPDAEVTDEQLFAQTSVYLDVARIMAILSQLAIVGGLVFIGYHHFGSFQMGVGMGTIFLMLPYTAQFAGDSWHLLPGALMVWSVAAFRKPLVAGALMGLAAGVCYYPFFLLPLWISFYWERGRIRFTVGAVLAIVVVVSSLILTSIDFNGFWHQLKSIFGFWLPRTTGLGGIWALNWVHWFRLPLLVAFIVLCVSYVFWPATKNLASLISCTAAAMVAVQYWHGDGGGLFLAWYVPLLLLIVFRPNLDDQVAITVLEERRRPASDEASGVVTAA